MVTWLLNSTPIRWGATIFVLVAGFVAALWRAHREGRQDARNEAMEDTHERTEAGREAVRDGRAAGTPDERLRRNDRSW